MMMLASMTTCAINNGVSKHLLAKVMELKLIKLLGIIEYVIVIDLKIFKNLNNNKVFSKLLMKGKTGQTTLKLKGVG
jgi:hypothetical protein